MPFCIWLGNRVKYFINSWNERDQKEKLFSRKVIVSGFWIADAWEQNQRFASPFDLQYKPNE